MRFIDYIKRNPVVCDPFTGVNTYDTSSLITEDTVSFVVDNVATQLIEGVQETGRPGLGLAMLSPLALELLRADCTEQKTGSLQMRLDELCVIPPYPNCFFEYRFPWTSSTQCEYEGVHVRSSRSDGLNVMVAEVYYQLRSGAASVIGVDSTAEIVSDAEGRILSFDRHARVSAQQATMGLLEMPNEKEFLIAIASMMLLSTNAATVVESEEHPMSRQQRRHVQRSPKSVQPPVRYYTLSVDLSRSPIAQGSRVGQGGWEQAWHRVRSHLRHLKSGKVIQVRAHHKGNPLKGELHKSYELKGDVEG